MPPDVVFEASEVAQTVSSLCAEVRSHFADGRFDEAWRVADRAYRIAASAKDAAAIGQALLAQAVVRAGIPSQEPEDIVDAAQAALRLSDEVGDAQVQAESLRIIYDGQMKSSQFAAAAQTARKLVDRCSRASNRDALAVAHLLVAKACLEGDERELAVGQVRSARLVYEDLKDDCGRARCHVQASHIMFRASEFEDAVEEADRARRLFKEAGDPGGEAVACLAMARAHVECREYSSALRAADEAGCLWRSVGDLSSEVDALIIRADVQIWILGRSDQDVIASASWTPVVKSVEIALKAARRYRANDNVCMAAALCSQARMLLRTGGPRAAWNAAKAAARCFRKSGNSGGRARALLLLAEAELMLGSPREARGSARAAMLVFDKIHDAEGISSALEICDLADVAEGIPTQAELAEQTERQQVAWLQQQQQVVAAQAQAGLAVTMSAPTDVPRDDHPGATRAVAFRRDGASPLQVGAGMDVDVVRKKVLELAAQIIGDPDDLEMDMPLMEAGLTSNTAVILRDELSKDLPGIPLPPTLIFDYPSISSIADYVVDRAK